MANQIIKKFLLFFIF